MAGGMGSSRGRGPSLAERTALTGAAAGERAAGGATGPSGPGPTGAGATPSGRTGADGTAPGRTGGDGTPGEGRAGSREVSGRHCWVVDPPEGPGRWPGLLAEWRRAPDGLWEGRVVYAVAVRDRCVLVEGWLGVHRLEQV